MKTEYEYYYAPAVYEDMAKNSMDNGALNAQRIMRQIGLHMSSEVFPDVLVMLQQQLMLANCRAYGG